MTDIPKPSSTPKEPSGAFVAGTFLFFLAAYLLTGPGRIWLQTLPIPL